MTWILPLWRSVASHGYAAVLLDLLVGDDEDFYLFDDGQTRNEDLSFLHQVRSEARSKIDHFESFVKGFLPGMSKHTGLKCHLRTLEKGVETSMALKKSIASYLGMPSGKEMPMLQKAVSNLRSLPRFRHICDCSYCERIV